MLKKMKKIEFLKYFNEIFAEFWRNFWLVSRDTITKKNPEFLKVFGKF